MPDTSEFSEAKRALLEKYLKGNLQQAPTARVTHTQHTKPENSNSRARVVQVQHGEAKQPFFFLHGSWKGTPFFCISLAHELDKDRPFYALEAYRFDGLSIPPTVEMMAAEHIKAMRAIQPEGPYLLGGWCNGGLVAYEIARQLHAEGQTLDLLVLMDAMYFGYHTRRKMLRVVISHLGNLIGLAEEKQLDWFLCLLYVTKPLNFIVHGLLHIYKRLQNISQSRSQDSTPLITSNSISTRQSVMATIRSLYTFANKHITLPHIHSRAFSTEVLRQDYLGIVEWIVMGYKPLDLYPGKITFFWPSNEPWHIVSAGWRNLLAAKEEQKVETYIIPGNQDTWRNKHLFALIEHLKMCLSEAKKEVL